MKTKIVTVISLAGVLIAGSAAALVNTQVLGGSASPSPLVVDAASPAQTSPTVLVAASGPAVTSPIDAATAAPAPVVTQAVYAIGDSGTVTLDTAGAMLTIVGVAPADGWKVTKSETNDPLNAEVRFQSGTTEVEFRANLLFGVVTTSVDSHDLSTQDTVSTRGNNGGGDDGTESGGDDD